LSHNRRELRDALRRDDRVVAEDAAEVVLVREDLILERQKDPGRIDEVDEWQAVVSGDSLGAEDLLRRHREEGPCLHGGIVGNDHDPTTADRADAGDDTGARRSAPLGVHLPRGPEAELEEGIGIAKQRDAFAGRAPALSVLALDGLCPPAEAYGGFLISQ
jgi:hypothetical protein